VIFITDSNCELRNLSGKKSKAGGHDY